ncbi:MAG: hypothetical protein BHV70_06805 [Bacteroidales bacterium 55_9]|nr:MAG: hypothetical protein BHV70_06805 [Bacteroidales bacterium 55_9]
MKAIFVACNQSIYDEVLDIMNRMQMRGYTGWEELMGCGSRNGEPHLGNHAWPTMNSALLTVTDDGKVDEFLKSLKELDEANEMQGLRAFVWDVTAMI